MKSPWMIAALVAGGLAAAGPAQADPAFGPSYEGGNCPAGVTCTHWCPGDPRPPGSHVVSWDWNVCHDWYWDSVGIVDVGTNLVHPWSGEPPRQAAPPPTPTGPPPAPAPRPPDCPPFNIPFLGPSRCGGL